MSRSLAIRATRSTEHTTSCAMRAPRRTTKGLFPKLIKNDANFAAIIGVDCPRTVENRHPIGQSQPRTGPDLRFKSLRQLDRQPGRDQRARPRRQDDFLAGRHCRHEIHPGGIFTLIRRQLQALGMRQTPVNNGDHSCFANSSARRRTMPSATSALAHRRPGLRPRARRSTSTWLVSPPNVEEPSATLLAMIRSHPFAP